MVPGSSCVGEATEARVVLGLPVGRVYCHQSQSSKFPSQLVSVLNLTLINEVSSAVCE